GLMSVKGVGEQKRAKYGAMFLQELKAYKTEKEA
ncbi:hypothetical protein, partial [Bacillus swezeyi]